MPAVEILRAAGAGPGVPVAVAWSPEGVGLACGETLVSCPGDGVEDVRRVLDAVRPRLVWWSARDAEPLVRAGVKVPSSWDLSATHRLLHGGTDRDPALVWAAARDLDPRGRPRTGQLDLLSVGGGTDQGDPADPDDPVRPDGHLRPGWAESGPPTVTAAARWAAGRARRAGTARGRAGRAAGPAALCRPAAPRAAHRLVGVGRRAAGGGAGCRRAAVRPSHCRPAGRGAGRPARRRTRRVPPPPAPPGTTPCAPWCPEPTTPTCATRRRSGPCSPGSGIDVPDTRAWRLEPFRGTHPVVEALLDWRKAERIATTYGYGWLDRDVGPDGRLRGDWTGCDGAAGRMTASAGLHNLPAELRPAVAAETGPRCSSAPTSARSSRGCSPRCPGDDALAGATADDDLYAPVAARLGGRPARPPRSRCSPRCTGRRPARPARRCAGWNAPTRWRWATCARRTRRVPPVATSDLRRPAGAGCGRCRSRPSPSARRPLAAGSPATPWCRARPPSCSRCGR